MKRLPLVPVLMVTVLPVLATAQSVTRSARIFRTEAIVALDHELVPLPATRLGLAHEPFLEDDEREVAPDAFVDAEGLLDLVTGFVARDSWSNSRNEITYFGSNLFVVQTPAVQEEIARLLRRLERRAQSRVRLEVGLVPPAALEAAASGWSKAGASPWLDRAVFDRALERGGARARSMFLRVRLGGRASVEASARVGHLVDHEVNQTMVLPVTNPVVRALSAGAFAAARVLPGPEGQLYRLDIAVGVKVSLPEPRETRRLPWGDLELVDQSDRRVITTVFAPAGATLVLGALELEPPARDAERETAALEPESFVAIARLGAISSRAEPGDDNVLSFIECGAFTTDAGEFLPPTRGAVENFFGEEPPSRERSIAMPAEILRDALRRLTGGDGASHVTGNAAVPTTLVARGEAETIESLRVFCAAETHRRLVGVTVDLWDGPVDTERLESAAAGALLDREWLRVFGEGGLRTRVAGLSGVPMQLNSLALRTHVVDVEKVSGGSGAMLLEMADPIVDHTEEGLDLEVTARLVPGRPWASLRIAAALTGPSRVLRQGSTRAPSTRPVVSGADEGATGEVAGDEPGAIDSIAIDLREMATTDWRHELTVPLGVPVLLRSAPDAKSPGASRVLVAVVHAFPLKR